MHHENIKKYLGFRDQGNRDQMAVIRLSDQNGEDVPLVSELSVYLWMNWSIPSRKTVCLVSNPPHEGLIDFPWQSVHMINYRHC